MKVTTVFLKRSLNNWINNTISMFRNIMCLTYISVLLIALTFFISNIHISENVISLATNIRKSNDDSIDISSLKNIYPTFNDTSYILRNNIVDEVITVTNDNKDKLSLIDNYITNDSIEVFMNKNKLDISRSEANNLERININDSIILNYSSLRNINFQELYERTITLTKTSDKILIYNTHTSESYSNCDKYKFEYSGVYRSMDSNFNVITVTSELEKNLREKNFTVIQDTTPHDYGTYTSAYARSRNTLNENIIKHGNFGLVIDLHRDAQSDLNFAPKVNINGVEVAKLMFVMGVGNDANRNEYYIENLSLAIQIQMLADKIYPGLFRPMIIRNSTYNQDLNRNSFLLEVGATGNTIDEAYYATRCLSNLLNILYKN